MHKGYPHNRREGDLETKAQVFFLFLCLKTNEIKKAKIKFKKEKEKKNYIQQGENEFTLKEYPGKADLPSSHYSPKGQNARGMASGVGH